MPAFFEQLTQRVVEGFDRTLPTFSEAHTLDGSPAALLCAAAAHVLVNVRGGPAAILSPDCSGLSRLPLPVQCALLGALGVVAGERMATIAAAARGTQRQLRQLSNSVSGLVSRAVGSGDGLTVRHGLLTLERWGDYGLGLCTLQRTDALPLVLAALVRGDSTTMAFAAAALGKAAEMGLDPEDAAKVAPAVLPALAALGLAFDAPAACLSIAHVIYECCSCDEEGSKLIV